LRRYRRQCSLSPVSVTYVSVPVGWSSLPFGREFAGFAAERLSTADRAAARLSQRQLFGATGGHGRTIAERAQLLIAIAAPEFREDLSRQAHALNCD